MLWNLLALALAGSAGTLTRYGVSELVKNKWSTPLSFPWATLAVNGVGCFLFGLIWALSGTDKATSPQLRLWVLTGFMGAFTTFSTFGFETAKLMQQGNTALAGINVLCQNGLGVGMAFLGMMLGQAMLAYSSPQ